MNLDGVVFSILVRVNNKPKTKILKRSKRLSRICFIVVIGGICMVFTFNC